MGRAMTPRRSLASIALRSFGGAFLAASAVALSFGSLAQAQAIAGFNSNQPVDYAADRIDQIDGFELTDLAPEDEQDVDPRLAELDLSAFGAVPPNEPSASVGEQDPRD